MSLDQVAVINIEFGWLLLGVVLLTLGALALQTMRSRRMRGLMERRVTELSALSEVGRAIVAAQLDVEELCMLIYHQVSQIVDTSIFQLGLFEGHHYRVQVWVDEGEHKPAGVFDLRQGEGIAGWMRRTGQPLLVHDFETEMDTLPARPRYISDKRPRSAVFVPLIGGDTVIGTMAVQSYRPAAFDADHQRLLSIIANQAAAAIVNARLYQTERRRREIADTLRQVSNLVNASLDTEEILQRILEGVQYLIPFDVAAIFFINDDDTFTLKAARGWPPAVTAVGTRWPMADGGCLQQLASTDQPLIFGPEDDLDAYHQLLDFPAGHSCLGLPIRIREKLIGVLALDHQHPGQYHAEDAALAAALASQAASALENARLYALQQEEVWISTALLEVAEATSLAESLDEVIETVVRITPMLVGVDRCAILLWNSDEAGYEVAAAYEPGDAPSPLQTGYVFSPGEWPLLDELWETGAPVVDEFGGLPGAPTTQDVETTLLALPLRSHGELTGTMVIGFTGSVSFNEQRVKLIAGIANQTAVAIESAELVVAQQEEAWASLALLQVAEAVANLSELNDVLDVVSRLTPLLVGVEGCLIYLWDAEQEVFRPGAAYGIASERIYRFQSTTIPAQAWPQVFEAAVSSEDAYGGGGAGSPDSAPVDAYHQGAWEPAGQAVLVSGPPTLLQDTLGLKAPLALPLQVWGELMGAIVVDVGNPERILSSRRFNILSGVAQQTATAIQNSLLHIESVERQKLEQELQLARQIQASFLPAEVPQIDGWDLAAYWQGARQVSGDFYDFVQLSDQDGRHGQWGFVMADVADKGMPAALFMALSRTLVRTMAMSGSGPAEVLAKANDMIMADSRSDLFVTLFYAILNAEQGILSYASAGHNPPLHFHAGSSRISDLHAEGIAMGVIKHIQLEQCQRVVEPGDVVLLYTDGVTDALNEAMEEFGLARLHRVLEENNTGSAADVIRAINQAVEGFVGDTPQFDDFTLVVLKREPTPGTA